MLLAGTIPHTQKMQSIDCIFWVLRSLNARITAIVLFRQSEDFASAQSGWIDNKS